jgi:zinc transporter ZupT
VLMMYPRVDTPGSWTSSSQVSRKLLDAMLAFAAGAMIFVVAEELIPEA